MYGPADQYEFGRVSLELGQVRNDWDVLWCISGDFNVVRYPGERLEASTSNIICESSMISLSGVWWIFL